MGWWSHLDRSSGLEPPHPCRRPPQRRRSRTRGRWRPRVRNATAAELREDVQALTLHTPACATHTYGTSSSYYARERPTVAGPMSWHGTVVMAQSSEASVGLRRIAGDGGEIVSIFDTVYRYMIHIRETAVDRMGSVFARIRAYVCIRSGGGDRPRATRPCAIARSCPRRRWRRPDRVMGERGTFGCRAPPSLQS